MENQCKHCSNQQRVQYQRASVPRRRAPKARAMAEAMPPPMAPADNNLHQHHCRETPVPCQPAHRCPACQQSRFLSGQRQPGASITSSYWARPDAAAGAMGLPAGAGCAGRAWQSAWGCLLALACAAPRCTVATCKHTPCWLRVPAHGDHAGRFERDGVTSITRSPHAARLRRGWAVARSACHPFRGCRRSDGQTARSAKRTVIVSKPATSRQTAKQGKSRPQRRPGERLAGRTAASW